MSNLFQKTMGKIPGLTGNKYVVHALVGAGAGGLGGGLVDSNHRTRGVFEGGVLGAGGVMAFQRFAPALKMSRQMARDARQPLLMLPPPRPRGNPGHTRPSRTMFVSRRGTASTVPLRGSTNNLIEVPGRIAL